MNRLPKISSRLRCWLRPQRAAVLRRANGAADAKGKTPAIDPASVTTPYATFRQARSMSRAGWSTSRPAPPASSGEVYVQEGDKVEKNEILARQEDNDARLSRNRVAAQLAQSGSAASDPAGAVRRRRAREKTPRAPDRRKRDLAAALPAGAGPGSPDHRPARSTEELGAARPRPAGGSNYQVELYVIRAPTAGTIVRRYANPFGQLDLQRHGHVPASASTASVSSAPKSRSAR
jgi:HlyD family secretion protein